MLRHCFHMKLSIRQRVGLFHKRLITLTAFKDLKWEFLLQIKQKKNRKCLSVMEDSKPWQRNQTRSKRATKKCLRYVVYIYNCGLSIDKLYGGCNYICFDSFRFFTVRVFSSQMSLMSIFSMIFYCTEEILCFMYPQHRFTLVFLNSVNWLYKYQMSISMLSSKRLSRGFLFF